MIYIVKIKSSIYKFLLILLFLESAFSIGTLVLKVYQFKSNKPRSFLKKALKINQTHIKPQNPINKISETK